MGQTIPVNTNEELTKKRTINEKGKNKRPVAGG
jgi:hypothetical protein